MQLATEQFDTDDEDDVYTLKAIKELFKPDGIMTELAMLRTPNQPLGKSNRIVNIYLVFMLISLAMNGLVTITL